MHLPTLTTQNFVASLQAHASKRLIFEYDGRQIQPGYHVTEIKAASFRSLDCGANPQQWNETIVQLWDVAGKPEESHMSVGKFLAIYRKVDADVKLEGAAEIKFECGDAENPAVHYTMADMRSEDDALTVTLAPVHASCKPRDRWWMSKTPVGEKVSVGEKDRVQRAQLANGSSCCGPASNAIQILEIANAEAGVAVASAACCASQASCCN